MHAFIRGKDVGFSAEKFYGAVADLLAGVEEQEGYVVDGKWVGWEGKEERKKTAMEVLTRTEEAASDKERRRMEEILRSTPSPPPSRSSPSSPYPEGGVEVHLEVQTQRRHAYTAESDGPQHRDMALQGDLPKGTDQECVISDTILESLEVRQMADSKREDTNLSTDPSPAQPQARPQETSPLLPRR